MNLKPSISIAHSYLTALKNSRNVREMGLLIRGFAVAVDNVGNHAESRLERIREAQNQAGFIENNCEDYKAARVLLKKWGYI